MWLPHVQTGHIQLGGISGQARGTQGRGRYIQLPRGLALLGSYLLVNPNTARNTNYVYHLPMTTMLSSSILFLLLFAGPQTLIVFVWPPTISETSVVCTAARFLG